MQYDHSIKLIMKVKMYVTRHGLTDWNVKGKTQENADIELNEAGIRQAK